MADINSKLEIGVTTGPIRGSRKVHVGARTGSGIRVAMREIDLEGDEPSVRVYDTSGPYTDPEANIDIQAGLPSLRRDWIMARGDVEEYDAREVKPEDNGQLGPDRSGGVQAFPNVVKRPLRAKARQNVSQMHYARQGIITPEMEYVAEAREPWARNGGGPNRCQSHRGGKLGREHSRRHHTRVCPRRGCAGQGDHSQQHQPPRE